MEVMKLYVSSYKKMMLNAEDTNVRCYCYTDIHELPRELSHFNTHRNEADGGEAEDEMALKVLMTKPQQFHILMKPITLLVTKAFFDNRDNTLTICMSEEDGDGVYRGGALLDTILRHRDESECQQPIYVSLELLTGVAPEMMEELEYQRSL